MSRRVLIFSLAYVPHIGGAEVAIKEITDRLPNIEFSLITLHMGNEPREERIGNVHVHRVGNGTSYLQKVLYVPRAALCAARLHRARAFDAFWAMMSYMLFPVVLLRLRGVRAPYLLTLQEGDPWERVFARWFILPLMPLLSLGFRRAAAVQTISTYLAGWAKRMGYPGTPEIIGNGVDTARFSQTFLPVDVEHMHAALGKRPGDVFLVTTSRLVEKNAVDDVIRALAFLPENVHFIVYGIGPDERKLQELSERLRLARRVHFKGHISHADMPLALAACDIYVRPSRSEGMGNVFVEAMAAGLPVIATQEGGIADFLFDAKRNPDKPTTGFAVDKDSPEQIAEAVRDILAHPEQVARVTANARRMAAERYDWDLIAKQMREVFAKIGV